MKTKQKNKKPITFWKVFIFVILIFIVIDVILKVIFFKNVNIFVQTETIQQIQTKLIKASPEIFTLLTALDNKSKEEIKMVIKQRVDELYRPIYANVDNYVNLHYSLKGDYAELFAGLSNNFNKYLQEHIFGKNFKSNLESTIKNINADVFYIIQNNSKEFKEKLKDKGFSQKEINFLVNQILNYSIEDTKKRYLNLTNNAFRGSGVGAGIVSGAIIGMKLASKQTAKILAKKILAKLAIKTGAKLAGAGAGASTGAEAGSFLGPPGAIVGGIVGAIVGWFATDEVVIKVDEYLNKDSFKRDIIRMIDNNKIALEKNLLKVYLDISHKLIKENKEKLQELKRKHIKEIL